MILGRLPPIIGDRPKLRRSSLTLSTLIESGSPHENGPSSESLQYHFVFLYASAVSDLHLDPAEFEALYHAEALVIADCSSGFLFPPPIFQFYTPPPVLIQQNLDAVRTSVEVLYRDYIEAPRDTPDYVDRDRLAGQVSRLRDLTLHLVVAGEVKSGKSSFVNALLGTPSSSSTRSFVQRVVEVAHGDRRHLEVTYASGDTEESPTAPTATGLTSARHARSRRRGARRLPRPAHRSSPPDRSDAAREPDRRPHPRPRCRPLRRTRRGCAADRVLGASTRLHRRARAPDQVATRSASLTRFPTVLRSSKSSTRPGVNAVGGIESVTRDYLRRADALLFVQSLATPTSSHSFRTFVEENVTDKIKEALFLILTHASTLGKTNRQERIEDARRNYGSVVGSERPHHGRR